MTICAWPRPTAALRWLKSAGASLGWCVSLVAHAGTSGNENAAPASTNLTAADHVTATPETPEPRWSWHAQNTVIVQGDPGFDAPYSGPRSLHPGGEVRETVSVDIMAGVRLWPGAEFHVDGLAWQGFGLSDTTGLEGFPSGEAFRLGTRIPNVNLARVFLRQSIGFGGESEVIEEDGLHLSGRQDVSRLTFTVGRFSAKDLFDNNRYANDARTQFMNWALMANEAWDYPADSLGYTTGLAIELKQPAWTWRAGFFQMPRTANGTAQDNHYLQAWGAVSELERRFAIASHPGAVRFLVFLNRAHMGSFQLALDEPIRPADIEATRAYREKFGFGVNLEQEITSWIGAFLRLGWNDGATESWAFADVDRTATLGVSFAGEPWQRPHDIFGLAGFINGISQVHHEFFAAGGTGILAGDGTLTYGLEKGLETYYDFAIWKRMRGALDYQFVANPAYNRDRGPVSILGARLHWDF
jgi:high affinity Mn2+ porin